MYLFWDIEKISLTAGGMFHLDFKITEQSFYTMYKFDTVKEKKWYTHTCPDAYYWCCYEIYHDCGLDSWLSHISWVQSVRIDLSLPSINVIKNVQQRKQRTVLLFISLLIQIFRTNKNSFFVWYSLKQWSVKWCRSEIPGQNRIQWQRLTESVKFNCFSLGKKKIP